MEKKVFVRRFRANDARAASRMIGRNLTLLSQEYPKKTICHWKKDFSTAGVKKMAEEGPAYLSVEKGRVTGLSILRNYKPNKERRAGWWLRVLFIEPACQKQGVGGHLLKRMQEIAMKKGAKRLFLHSSLNAIKFYQKMGFKKLLKYRVPSGGWTWRMSRKLSSG